MIKDSTKQIVKRTFQSSFDKEQFLNFAKNLLNHIDESKAQHFRGYIKHSFKQTAGIVKTYERLGTYTDPDEKKIDILIVYLEKDNSIDRARTSLRNFVADYLKQRDQKDAALVAFVSPNLGDWRFSLIKMDYKFEEGKGGKIKVKEEFTPARRWSFLVGVRESSHTAQSRLAPILEDDANQPRLEQLEEAFNIEKVTKEFFEKYRELFLRLRDSLDEMVKKDARIKADFAEKDVDTVDFAKKLLGQIVFLYFLQKKGWFGVPMDKNWGEGDKVFLKNLFSASVKENKNYFNNYLEPLFYEALAKQRDDDYYSRFNCRIPFLNGGLFDPISDYDWVNTDIDLPGDLFSNDRKNTKTGDIGDGILDIFDRYNFTVREDEPLEKEVAVDPEMLGKVFENLLEVKDRKSKGTYYTPREIVHYMCEQSLINYLDSELQNEVKKGDIESFVKIGEQVIENEYWVSQKGNNDNSKIPKSIKENAEIIDSKLADIKVCDPAIGSGAFPVGMMNKIVSARLSLNPFLRESSRGIECAGRTAYDFKMQAITNSIYGVDIDPGAVEIAKLRLWLSLVVDENNIRSIKPLPNLDYKIMQGNSLLEEFEGIKLFDESIIPQERDNREERIKKANLKINELQREYIKLHSQRKLSKSHEQLMNLQLREQRKLIESLRDRPQPSGSIDLFNRVDEIKAKWDELSGLHKKIVNETNRDKKKTMLSRASELEWEFIEASLKCEGKSESLKNVKQFKKKNTKPFFLWHLHFTDVFQNKGGFDVMVGNPPYISALQNTRDDKSFRESYRKRYPLVKGAFDIYAIFLIMGIELTNHDGSFSWIIPNKLMVAQYAEDVLNYLKGNGLYSIVSVSNLHVFENVGVYPVIVLGNKKTNRFQSFEIESLSDLELNKLTPKRIVKKHEIFKNFNIKISSGATGFQAQQLVKCISENKSDNTIPFVVSGSIDPWMINFGHVRYMNKIYEKAFIVKDRNIAGSKWDFWMNEKIIISGMTKRIEAAYYNEPVALGVGVYGIYHYGNFNPKFILALLNSKYLSYYLKIKFKEKHLAGGYLAINKSTIEQLPIVNLDFQQQEKYVEIVDKILALTKSDDYLSNPTKQSKVHKYERQIDQMVYKLYSLTAEEINIIEDLSK